MSIIRRFFYKGRKFYDDDFDWNNYTRDSYERRLTKDVEARHITKIDRGNARIDHQRGEVVLEGQQLHPNHQLILDAIVRLAPDSVHEVGCGGGDHVRNLKELFSDVTVTGGDRSASQLAFALQRHAELDGSIGVQDITMPYSRDWPKADLVYSQAVIMHIHTAVSHLVALSNMVRIAQKYVLLVENFQCHNFVQDILALHKGGHFSWDTLHLHLLSGSTGANAILLSREPLDLAVLTSDEQLRKGEKISRRRLKRADEDSQRGAFGFDQSFEPE